MPEHQTNGWGQRSWILLSSDCTMEQKQYGVTFYTGIMRLRIWFWNRVRNHQAPKKALNLMFIGPCIIAIVDEWKTNLMSLAILFHLLCAQHVSDIIISIFRSPQPPHTTWTEQLCFSLQNEYHQIPAATKAPTHNELRYVQSEIHITKYINKALNTKQPMKNTTHKRTQWSQSIADSGQNQLKYTYQLQKGNKTHHTKHTITHRKVTLILKHPSLQKKTTYVVIHQHSRKLLKMDILMSETCWAHNKWNNIASDIKLVFHSSRHWISSAAQRMWHCARTRQSEQQCQ